MQKLLPDGGQRGAISQRGSESHSATIAKLVCRQAAPYEISPQRASLLDLLRQNSNHVVAHEGRAESLRGAWAQLQALAAEVRW